MQTCKVSKSLRTPLPGKLFRNARLRILERGVVGPKRKAKGVVPRTLEAEAPRRAAAHGAPSEAQQRWPPRDNADPAPGVCEGTLAQLSRCGAGAVAGSERAEQMRKQLQEETVSCEAETVIAGSGRACREQHLGALTGASALPAAPAHLTEARKGREGGPSPHLPCGTWGGAWGAACPADICLEIAVTTGKCQPQSAVTSGEWTLHGQARAGRKVSSHVQDKQRHLRLGVFRTALVCRCD